MAFCNRGITLWQAICSIKRDLGKLLKADDREGACSDSTNTVQAGGETEQA